MCNSFGVPRYLAELGGSLADKLLAYAKAYSVGACIGTRARSVKCMCGPG